MTDSDEPTHDDRPVVLSGSLAVLAGAVGVTVTASGSGFAPLVGLLGAFTVTAGIVIGRRGSIALGAMLLFAGTVLTGVTATSAPRLALGIAAAYVTWDLGEYAVDVGEQVGRHGHTWTGEATHAAWSGLVALVSVVVVQVAAVVRLGVTGSVTAIVFLVVAAILLLGGLG